MQFKQRFAYIASGCIIVLSSAILLINVRTQAPERPQIVFHSDRDGNYEIYVMDTDGKNQRRLTNHPAIDVNPAWSPDGQRIAFESNRNRDGKNEIYVMDADGRKQRRLTNNPAWDLYPAWSPDGQRIAFHSDRAGNYEIYVMDADGGNLRNMTNNPNMDSLVPAWSPDGQSIAFHSDRAGNYEIYIMDADGGNLRNMTNNPMDDLAPAWSPDGQSIAFHSDGAWDHTPWPEPRFEGAHLDAEIYVMDADGRNRRRLTNNPAADYCPAWSPDGQRIAFQSTRNRDGRDEIHVMDADGKNLRRLTNNPAWDGCPDWFDPASALVTPVSFAGKLRGTWGWLKQTSR